VNAENIISTSIEVKPRLIVGLGNPGDEYTKTRHNVGFMVIDKIIETKNCSFKKEKKFNSIIFGTCHRQIKQYFMKPMTYMNLSGEAVAAMMAEQGIALDELLVIYDCMDLPLGRIRLRQKGSSGGHRGVESLIQHLNSNQFSRLRFGIGTPQEGVSVVDYVLSSWTREEESLGNQVIKVATQCILCTLDNGITVAMNKFNCWKPAVENKLLDNQ